MHVINCQDIHATNARAKCVNSSVTHRLDIFIGELLGRDVANALLSARLAPTPAQCLQQMGFANAATSVNDQAISNHVSRGKTTGGIKSHFVGWTHHKVLKAAPRFHSPRTSRRRDEDGALGGRIGCFSRAGWRIQALSWGQLDHA